MNPTIVFIKYLSIFSTVLPLVLLGFNFKTFNKTLKVLFFYLSISLIADLISNFLALAGNTTNHIIAAFTLLEFVCIAYIYFLEKENASRTRFILITVLFTVYNGLVYAFSENILQISLMINVAETLIMIAFSLIYFFQLIENKRIGKLSDYYFFWFNLAVLIYFSSVLFVFLFINQILKAKSNSLTNLWAIHNVSHILYNILIAIGIFKWKSIRK